MSSATLVLELKRDRQAPSVARAAVDGSCHGLKLSDSLCATLVLLVSEVVTNAVRHSGAPPDKPIIFTTRVTPTAIHVAVTDTGNGFIPKPRNPNTTQGGYGLYLVEKAARRWGVERIEAARRDTQEDGIWDAIWDAEIQDGGTRSGTRDSGTRVWFELERAA